MLIGKTVSNWVSVATKKKRGIAPLQRDGKSLEELLYLQIRREVLPRGAMGSEGLEGLDSRSVPATKSVLCHCSPCLSLRRFLPKSLFRHKQRAPRLSWSGIYLQRKRKEQGCAQRGYCTRYSIVDTDKSRFNEYGSVFIKNVFFLICFK